MHFQEAQAFTQQKDEVLRPCSTLSCPNNSCAITKQMMFVMVRLSSEKTNLQDQHLTSTKQKLRGNTEVSVHDVLTHRQHPNSKLKLFILIEIRKKIIQKRNNSTARDE